MNYKKNEWAKETVKKKKVRKYKIEPETKNTINEIKKKYYKK